MALTITEKAKRSADLPSDSSAPPKRIKKESGFRKKSKEPVKTEKTDWNDLKTKKKDLKVQRKKSKVKDLYELSVQAKQIYEKLKCKSTENKHQLCHELHAILKNGEAYPKLIHSHDIARVVQTLLKYSPAEIKREISTTLLPHIVAMAQSKYAHFAVARMLKYGTKEIREGVVDAFFGSLVRLVSHNFASSLVDIAFTTYGSERQRQFMRQEFYSDLYKSEKNAKVASLADTWKGSPELKAAMLGATKTNLLHCANKKLVDNALLQAVLLEFLGECGNEDRAEVVEVFGTLMPQLGSTKDGSRAASICYLHSSTKERRAILKGLREHIERMCGHEFGHLIVLTVINVTDDTVMLGKTVLNVILEKVEAIVATEWGRKVVAWMVSPEDTTFFHPQLSGNLNEGLKFSKKDATTRRAEISAAVVQPLCKKIEESPEVWLRGGHVGLLTGAIMKAAKGDDSKAAYEALAKVICNPEWKVNVLETAETPEKPPEPSIRIKKIKKNPLEKELTAEASEQILGIEHAGLHIALKKLIKLDKEKSTASAPTLTSAFIDCVSDETLSAWMPLNRACFTLVTFFENGSDTEREQLRTRLATFHAALKKQSHMGAKILIKKLQAE